MKAILLAVAILGSGAISASDKQILFKVRENTKAVAVKCIKHEDNVCGQFQIYEGLGKSIESLEYKALGEVVWASNMVNIKRWLKQGDMVGGKYYAPGFNLYMKWLRGMRDGDDPVYGMLAPLVPFMAAADMISAPVQFSIFVGKYLKYKKFRQQRRQRRDARRILRKLKRFVGKQKTSKPRKVTEESYKIFRDFFKSL